MGLFLHIFFQYQIRGFFWLESFFAIEIKGAHALDRKNSV